MRATTVAYLNATPTSEVRDSDKAALQGVPAAHQL